MRCIAQGTLIASLERNYAVGQESSVLLNNGDPLRLRTTPPPAVYLSLGQRFEIVRDDAVTDGPYRVHTREYWYQFSLEDGRELFAFHWTPDAADSRQRRYPHLHVGVALLLPETPILSGVLHKRHIPTGRISIENIVRFAIEELGAEPLIDTWHDVLDQGQQQFNSYRRP